MSAPPGWYPDPEYMGRERYWTGAAWTDQSRPRQPGSRPRPEASAVVSQPLSGLADRAVPEQQPSPDAVEPGPAGPRTVPDGRALAGTVEEPVATSPGSEQQRWRRGLGTAVAALAAVATLGVGGIGAVAPVAFGLYLAWGMWGAVVPFVVWWAPAPLLSTLAAQRWAARVFYGCRELDAVERGRVAEPWHRVQRRTGVQDGGYRLMVIESEDLNACTAVGRIVAITSSSSGGSLATERVEAVLAHELGHRLGWRRGLGQVNAQMMLPVSGLWWVLRVLWTPVAPMWRRAVAWHRPIGFLLTFLLAFAAAVVSVVVAAPTAVSFGAVRLARLSAGLQESDADAVAVRLGLGAQLLAAIEEHIEAAHDPRGGRGEGGSSLVLPLVRRAGRLRKRLADQGVSP